ncbi:MAG: aminomethyltransferase family protein [Nocardioides sp.]
MSHYLVQGPHAMAVLNRVCANDVDTATGRVVYTQWLDDHGGIIADVTVTRLADDQYVVISGDTIHRRIPAWIRRQTRVGEFLTVTDVTGAYSLLSVQGPRSREVLQALSPDDWSDEAFGYLTARKVELGYTPLWALRVTYVGELGWDLLVPTEFGATLYDQLREAAADVVGSFRPTGIGALDTMRLEKAFRDMGHDIDSTDTPLEAGLGFAVAWDKPGGFVGRDALLRQKEAGPPQKRLVNVLLGSPDHDLHGIEPVYWDGAAVGIVRSGGFGHSSGRPAASLRSLARAASVSPTWRPGRSRSTSPGPAFPRGSRWRRSSTPSGSASCADRSVPGQPSEISATPARAAATPTCWTRCSRSPSSAQASRTVTTG